MSQETCEIPLQLQSIKSFFQAPEIDPFTGEDNVVSGIEQVMDTMKIHRNWKSTTFRIVITVPPDAPDLDLAPQLPRALATYCAKRMQYARRKRTETRLEGRQALRIGIVFLAICLAASATVERLLADRVLIGNLLAESLMIAGWVGLWRPMELLLNGWWPFASDVDIYEKIRNTAIEVRRAAPAA